MKKGLLIYTIILLVAAIVIDFMILKPRSIPASTTHAITVGDRYITVSGNTDEVNATTASEGYYRYRSGDALVEGQFISGNYFQNTSTVPVGRWIIESHREQVSFTISSTAPVSLFLVSTPDRYFATILLTVLFTAFFWFMGWAITDL